MPSALLETWAPGAVEDSPRAILADVEARLTYEILRAYYWLVDIAPIVLKYETIQLWRDAKREVAAVVSDLMFFVRLASESSDEANH